MAEAAAGGGAVGGCFVNGEIGPMVAGGAHGWRGGSGGGADAGGGGAADGPADTLQQSFTSIFVAAGAVPEARGST